MSNEGTGRTLQWWRGFWDSALTGGDTMVNVRIFDQKIGEMLSDMEVRESEVEDWRTDRGRAIADLAAEKKRSEMHATLNRGVAEALGLPLETGWYDLPERVAAKVAECEEMKQALADEEHGHVAGLYSDLHKQADALAAKKRECEDLRAIIGPAGIAKLAAMTERAEKAEQDAKDEKESHWKWRDACTAAEDRIAELVEALESIAKNTCCGRCQEAALVAKKALAGYGAKEDV